MLGPKNRPYISTITLAHALYEKGVVEIVVTIVSDLSALEPDAFWVYLDNRCWTHLYDATDECQSHKELPKHVARLIDDPYRSLAGALRRADGFTKDIASFSEFL